MGVGAPSCDGVTDSGILELAPHSPSCACVSPPLVSLSPCSPSCWCVPSRGGGRGHAWSVLVLVRRLGSVCARAPRARQPHTASMNLLGPRGSAARLDYGA